MNKELRRVSVLVLLMFLALFTSSSIIQVFQQDELAANPFNARTLYDSFSAERGAILVDGIAIANSVPVDDEYSYQREYSNGPLYAAVTGYFTLDQGTTGIEGELNDFLSGTASEQFLDRVNAILTGQNPQGAAVQVTIDPTVQQAAWDALGDLQGSVVAIDPSTGAILAMVSKPSFDPNDLASHDSSVVIQNYTDLLNDPDDPLINRAISGDLYHPGSTFKLIVAAAALESGEYTPDSELPNPRTITLPESSSVVSNSGGGTCGGGDTVTIADALRLSCNVPFAELGQELGYEAIAEQAARFGFGDESITVPMSVTPSIFPQTDSEAQLMLASFGQANVRVTPLEMAMVSSAVATGGTLMSPTLVDRIVAPDLSIVQSLEPQVYGTPLSSETAALLRDMMINNVASGAASNATIAGVDVAGKTGTAQNGEGEPYTLWFTGFAPADNPQVAVAVVVEDGGGLGQSGVGNTVAAPIAKKVIEAVLNR